MSLNISLLPVETDKDMDCVFLRQHLACLSVLHDFLSSLSISSWKDFYSALPFVTKRIAIYFVFENYDNTM